MQIRHQSPIEKRIINIDVKASQVTEKSKEDDSGQTKTEESKPEAVKKITESQIKQNSYIETENRKSNSI